MSLRANLLKSFASPWLLIPMMAWPALAQMPNPPGQVAPGETPRYEAYLFAHMMAGDYWRLYYSVSRDGLHWDLLNHGRRVLEEYRGHADICRGHDGRYYLIGNRSDAAPDINFWVSDDLIHWRKHHDYVPDLQHVPDYPKALARIGAPKVYFDEGTRQYLVTWHTTHDLGPTDLPEPYWAGQRTLYATSRDLKTFSDPPRKLFDDGWDMATIDTIVRRVGDRYYAILKDERYPTREWPTGKTIRIASAPDLLGPYGEPGPPVSPGFREAPALIPSPNGQAWYLYYEQYPGVAYGLSVAESMDGPWFPVAGNQRPDWDKYRLPSRVRHGCMLPIRRAEYDALVAAFPSEPQPPGSAATPSPAPERLRQNPHLGNIPLAEIRVRDPFILPDQAEHVYYLVASSGHEVTVRQSTDLKRWGEPRTVFTKPEGFWGSDSIWAPELHAYQGKFYLFATCMNDKPIGEPWENWPARIHRGTQVLVADSPLGPFKPFANVSHTPTNEMALDGTFWVEDGIPYMIYCHEWVQIRDGTIQWIRLKDDLSGVVGEPRLLFKASEASWTPPGRDRYVTDGPALYRSKSGKLLLLWSSFTDSGYTTGVVISDSGKLAGPWRHHPEPLFRKDGGHAMIFRRWDGTLLVALHSPNRSPNERCHLFEVEDTGETLRIVREMAP